MTALFSPDVDDRAEPRDEVLYRTRATLADRRTFPATIVNVSPRGLMMRGEVDVSAGEWLRVQLPGLGEVHAAVRWSLGGRIGCELDRPIDPHAYHGLLFAMRG